VLERLRKPRMDDKADVGSIDPHPEGDRFKRRWRSKTTPVLLDNFSKPQVF
jgi:hypothetical protein